MDEKIKEKNIKDTKEKRKKLKTSLYSIFKYLLLIIVLSFIFYNNIYQLSSNGSIFRKNIINTKLFHVIEKTMEDVLFKDDVAIINTKTRKYEVDDIVLIQDQSGVKIERVMEVIDGELENTKRKYITKADGSYYFNNFIIEEDMVIGKYSWKLPKAGWLLQIARSKVTTIVVISILIIVLFFLLQIRLYKPMRGQDEDISTFGKLKRILSKWSEKSTKKDHKHSRKAQREKIDKKIASRKKNNK